MFYINIKTFFFSFFANSKQNLVLTGAMVLVEMRPQKHLQRHGKHTSIVVKRERERCVNLLERTRTRTVSRVRTWWRYERPPCHLARWIYHRWETRQHLDTPLYNTPPYVRSDIARVHSTFMVKSFERMTSPTWPGQSWHAAQPSAAFLGHQSTSGRCKETCPNPARADETRCHNC